MGKARELHTPMEGSGHFESGQNSACWAGFHATLRRIGHQVGGIPVQTRSPLASELSHTRGSKGHKMGTPGTQTLEYCWSTKDRRGTAPVASKAAPQTAPSASNCSQEDRPVVEDEESDPKRGITSPNCQGPQSVSKG